MKRGRGPRGVAINRASTLALVANRLEGTVSVFSIAGKILTPLGKVQLGDAKSGPSAVAFTPDGKRALVTRDGDHKISVLTMDGTKVTHSGRDMYAGLKPYPVGVSPKGDFAAVSSVGMGNGDSDTISLIDLTANPPRVVDTVTVGQTPESVTVAPDGKHIVVTLINGTSKPVMGQLDDWADKMGMNAELRTMMLDMAIKAVLPDDAQRRFDEVRPVENLAAEAADFAQQFLTARAPFHEIGRIPRRLVCAGENEVGHFQIALGSEDRAGFRIELFA